MGQEYGEDPARGRVMPDPADQDVFCTPADGFHGLWHGQIRLDDSPYAWKYSGGLGTYPAQQRPQAVYAEAVHKTFFCWGGTPADNWQHFGQRVWSFQPGNLLQCVAAYDHARGRFDPPIVVFDKWCADPHDNPVLQLDAEGHLWLFSPSHGDWTTRSFIHRSSRPHAFDRWETVSDGPLFAYPQPHYDPERGFALLHTVYADGRGLHIKHSRDGRDWTPSRRLAAAGQGHYQVSHHDTGHGVLWTAFDYHPHEGGLDRRTNLYVMRSDDWGVTWRTADGRPVELPIDSPRCAALVHDFEGEAQLCFIKDLITDAEGRPLVLYSTSRGWEPGPQHGPHTWWLARQHPGGWTHHRITDSDHNYDAGSLFVDAHPGGGERLTLIGATEPGPQPFSAGGRIAVWTSNDAGVTWARDQLLIPADAEVNHNYPRRPLHAHPGFRVFWADGHGYQPSSSSLWFAAADDPAARRVAVRLATRSNPRALERPRQPQLPAD